MCRSMTIAFLFVLQVFAAQSLWSQAPFYQEERRGDLLYVFADPAMHGRYLQTGEIVAASVRKDTGDADTTVLFDSPAAARLYAERHPAVVPARAERAPQISWDNGETIFEFEKARVALSNRMQFRFTEELPDDTLQLPGTRKAGAAKPGFRIRRAKTRFEGWLGSSRLSYELQIGWAGSDSGVGGGTTFSGLEDAMMTWDLSRDGRLMIRLGQFKVPFGRQEMTSSERLQFVDRSILSGEMTHSRDVGACLLGRLGRGQISYWLGAFNGNQRNRLGNDNDKFQYNARVSFEPWGEAGLSEGDFESHDKPLMALSGEFEQNDMFGVTNATDFKTTIYGADLVCKYRGASLFGEIFKRKRVPETGASFRSNGYHLQAGYFLKRHVWELAVRYAAWDPTDGVAGNDRIEWGSALNYYISKHRLKLQADYRRLEDKETRVRNNEIRAQAQIAF
ncbi:MAG: OprO/OprP family phosphate-selective porin [Vicinamibacteria bacterium]|nr:OprO/OprP family phosphate-selective porin [Vicinamibacteria bacterium]